MRRRTRGPTLLDARAPLVEPLLALRGRQRRPSLGCRLKNQISARLSGRGHDSVFVHPGLDPIAHRLLLVRVEIVVPVLQGFFDVVFVIATVRMVVDPNPEIVIIPIVMLIEPVIVDVGDRAAVGRALARAATKQAHRAEKGQHQAHRITCIRSAAARPCGDGRAFHAFGGQLVHGTRIRTRPVQEYPNQRFSRHFVSWASHGFDVVGSDERTVQLRHTRHVAVAELQSLRVKRVIRLTRA